MKESSLNKNNISFIVKLVVILLSFCVFNTSVKAGNLSQLSIQNYDEVLNPTFQSNIYEYSLDINPGEIDLYVTAVAQNPNDDLKIEGDKYITANEGVLKITLTETNNSRTVYLINWRKIEDTSSSLTYTFGYTGDVQTLNITRAGLYKVELWGASGGTDGTYSGRGGYVSGKIKFPKDSQYFVYVGSNSSGFNGGGTGASNGVNGGGATDIRLVSGAWNNSASLASRIIVAGGGGGWEEYNGRRKGGAGGNLTGGKGVGDTPPNGGTQTSGGTGASSAKNGGFGYGGPGENWGGGGGGGYFGGAAGANSSTGNSGAGGSSYISGHLGSVAILASNSVTARNDSNGNKCTQSSAANDITCSYHYSGKKFSDTIMKSGTENMPTTTGTGTMTGNLGNGYAKITRLFDISRNNYLTSITSNRGVFNKSFKPTDTEYELVIDTYDRDFTLSVTSSDEDAVVVGAGKYLIDYREDKEVPIVVTAEAGDIKVYTIHVKRKTLNPVDHNSKLSKLKIANYSDEIGVLFECNTYEYDIVIPTNEVEVVLDLDTYDDEATYTVEGNTLIDYGSGDITIKVSEPHVAQSTYTLHYTKAKTYEPVKAYVFSYTGGVQTFVAPRTSLYKFEAWGASGGTDGTYSGRGAYTSGLLQLNKDDVFYVYVGSSGGGFNGGGTNAGNAVNGGGSSDIRLVNGSWDNVTSLRSRVMVAAGGGGWEEYAGRRPGGYGGALIGGNGSGDAIPTGATQISGGTGVNSGKNGSFGRGGTGENYGGGGGSGFYGGAAGANSSLGNAGAGGSSYVSGYLGSVAVKSASDSTPRNDRDGVKCTPTSAASDLTCSKHYSNVVFGDTSMIAGNQVMPNTAGTGTVTGNLGNGYVKITRMEPYSADNYLSSITSSKGTFDKEFDPTITDYVLTIGTYDKSTTLSATTRDENGLIFGLGEYSVIYGQDNLAHLTVTAENGETRVYTVNIKREKLPSNQHTTKLDYLTIEGYSSALDPTFDSDTYHYGVEILASELYLNIITSKYDENATVTIEGNQMITNANGTITITVSEPHCEDSVYTIDYVKIDVSSQYKFSYNGSYQKFTSPKDGKYKIQLWGASGGNNASLSGRGAYTEGIIYLEGGESVYLYIGQMVAGTGAAYNGGGYCGSNCTSGGGATDVRYFDDTPSSSTLTWNSALGLNSRIMVAAGGGGVNYWSSGYYGGYGGGLTGGDGNGDSKATGANQTEGGKDPVGGSAKYGTFGQGGYGDSWGGGGGGGFYGGGGGSNSASGNGGGGGSSYISGHLGTASISSSTDRTPLSFNRIMCTTGNNNPYCSYHYSNKVFTETKMVDGKGYNWTNTRGNYVGMPTLDNTSTMTGNLGNGYAIITFIEVNKNNYLTQLVTDKGTLSPAFDVLEENYTLELTDTDTSLKVGARPSSDLATISGIGEYDIPAGETIIPITVTAESGDIRIYTITVTRPANNYKYPSDITISGLVPSYCQMDNSYCKQNPASFNQNTTDYDITIPYKIKEIFFNVEKGHKYQKVNGEGAVTVKPNINNFTITITAEDESDASVYNYHVTRDMTGDNDLSTLLILNPSININYDPDITEYYYSVSNTFDSYVINSNNRVDSSLGDNIMQIYYKTDDDEATAYMLGDGNLTVGQNVIPIMVVAKNGETQTYTLNVYREANSNTYLSSIRVVNDSDSTNYELTPDFNKSYIGPYKTTVPKDVDKVNINVTTESATTTVSGDGLKTLAKGQNEFNVVTTSQRGDTETYKVVIYREKDNNTNLSSLNVKIDGVDYNLTPEFDKDELNYTINAPIGADTVQISATPEENTSTVQLLDNDKLRLGNNLKRITVKAEDESTKTYNITIVRPPDNNNDLSDLKITNGENELLYSPEFNENQLTYSLTVENDINYVNVEGTRFSNLATISGNGRYSLVVGSNEIRVKVTSESKEDKVYVITIVRKPNTNAFLKNITTNVGVLAPIFDKDTISYVINVDSTVNSIDISGVPFVNTTKVSGNGTYSLNTGDNYIDLTTLAEDNVSSLTYSIKVVKDRSSNANLEDLFIEEGVFDQAFNKGIINYNVKVPNDVENVHVHYTKEVESSIVTVEGATNLVEGENEVKVTVKAEDESTKTYTIKVVRQLASDVSNYLSSLTVDKGELSPAFNKTKTYYEVEVPFTDTSITVTADKEDEFASISGTGNYNLDVGDNLIVVRVTGSDDITRDYQIRVNRLKNNEARLSNVAISDNVIDFKKDIYEYNITIKKNSVDFTNITPMDSNATYEIINNSFAELGYYVVKIKVTAQNGETTKEYRFNVTKTKSDNANLSSLEVEGYTLTPTFNKDTLDYSLTTQVENEINSVNIIATTEESHATIDGAGINNLNVGNNQFIVKVTAHDNTEKEYKINIVKKGSSNNKVNLFEVLNGTLSPNYTNDNLVYSVAIPYEETSLDFNIVLDDANATYTFEGNSNLNVGSNVVRVLVTAENGSTRIITLNVTRAEAISALLSNLEITNYSLIPNFDTNTFNYNVVIDYEVSSLDIKPTTLDRLATYEIIGNNNLIVGNNTITINVSSRDNNLHQTYTLNVIKQGYANNFLKSLTNNIGEFDQEFNKNTLTYTIDVGSSISEIELFAEAEDENATVTGTGLKPLVSGTNRFVIGVSLSGVSRNYIVYVNKKNENNYLSDLKVKVNDIEYQITPEFSKNVYDYEVSVPAKTPNVNIIATAENSGVTISGTGIKPIQVGDNLFEINVQTSPSSSIKYKLKVKRPASDDKNIVSIVPSSGQLSPDFENDQLTYDLKLNSNISKLSFNVDVGNSNASVVGNEEQNVAYGSSTRVITITAEDGTQKEYTININRCNSNNAYLSNLSINGYSFEESFDKNNFEYHITVPNDYNEVLSSNVIAIPEDGAATVTKLDSLVLKTKTINEYDVIVKSSDETKTNTYKIFITRTKSSYTGLDFIEVDKGKLSKPFVATTREYDVYTYDNATKINVNAEISDPTVTIISGLGDIELPTDDYEHKIMLQAEDGSIDFYKLIIHKIILLDEGLNDLGLNNLEGLECLTNECILDKEFNTDTIEYDIKVPDEYQTLDLFYEKQNEQQSVKIKIDNEYVDYYNLPKGRTKIYVEVYDGLDVKTKTYILNVERLKNRNTYLSSLSISGYDLSPTFNKTVQEYSIRVPLTVDNLDLEDIIAIPEVDTSRVIISGYTYLLEGVNDMEVAVVSEGRTSRTYIVHVIKGEDKISDLKNITVSTGIFHNLSPKFSPTIYDYTVNIPSIYDKATVEAVVDDSSLVNIEGTGEYNLRVGNNYVTITSTSTITGQVSVYNVNIIKLSDEDVDLIQLAAREGELSPEFDRSTTKYTMNVSENVDNLTLYYQKSNSEAKVMVTGNANFVSGDNKVNVIVTNPEGTKTKTYQITVKKNKNSNPRLKSITVKDVEDNIYELTPTFNNNDKIYNVEVPYEIDKVLIEAPALNNGTTVLGDGLTYLNYGDNQVVITSTAEDGTIDNNFINIYRNHNLDLESLVSDNGTLTPAFDKDETNYVINVANNVDNITLTGTPVSNKVIVRNLGLHYLQVGDNEIKISVVSPDNKSKDYNVTVKRAYDNNNYIKDLQVNGIISPVFDKLTEEYQVDVRPSVSELDLNIELESNLATYEILNNNLSMENNPTEVIIRVRAQNGNTRDYKLNTYVRDLSFFSNQLKDMWVDHGQLTPDFNPAINNYAVTVENSIDNIEVRTLKDNQYQTIKINGVVGSYRTIPLSVGRNEIKVEVINPSNTETNTYSIIVYRSATSDASLSNLVVEGHQFYPYYAKNIYEYDLDIESEEDNLNVIATPSDSNSKVEISGNNNIPPGRSEIRIKVTAPDNITTKEYTIKVNKVPSTNNYLSSLTVTDYNLDKTFTKTDQGPYTINVGTNVTNINVKGIAESSKATVTGDGVKSLSKGRNEIQITVTSESGDARIYTLIVNRAYNDDAYLTNILLSDGDLDPEFNKNTFIYEVEVDESVEEVSVTGVLSDNNASIIGNDTYDLTENEETNVTLKVTAENSLTTQEYKIKFIRHVNASSYLSKLIVKDGELYPGFHKLITTYTILVPNEVRSLDMTYVPEDENANVQVTGNSSFKVGTNKVHIVVTAKDNSSTTDYEISVVRQSKASNYLKTLKVLSNDGLTEYTLIPEFDKTKMYYEVMVPVQTQTINIEAEAEDPTSTLRSTELGMKSLNTNENKFYVTVEALSGAIRSYQVVVTKQRAENLLLTLESDKGILSPEFNSTTKEYELRVPKGTSKVELTGTISENATVTGLGEVMITEKQQTQNIVVTSLSGETNTYQVNIIEEDGSDVDLISLTPSSGELDPEFSNNVNDYTIEVDDNVGTISFDVVPQDPKVKIEGNAKTNLTYGENDITITITSEDNSASKDIHIKVTRVKSLEKIVAEDTIVLGVNEEKELEYTLVPNDATYKEVSITNTDDDIATIEDNKVKGKKIGTTSIKIQSQKDSKVYKIINVSVINKLITSEVYEVVHFSEEELESDSEGKDNYVIDLEPKTKIKDFLPKFENVLSTLSVYDKNGNKIEDENTTLGTGMKLKLIVEGQEYDHVTIIVRGDLNGDSIINVNDYKKLNNYILKTLTFNYIEKKASDLNKDNIVNVNDYKKLNNYVLKNISSVNPPRD